jgi:hypothetical protein
VQFYLFPEQGIITVQYIMQFYLCPEQGIIKKCNTTCNFTSAQSRALEKVQYMVRFYLCPDEGIIKKYSTWCNLPLHRAGHYKSAVHRAILPLPIAGH